MSTAGLLFDPLLPASVLGGFRLFLRAERYLRRYITLKRAESSSDGRKPKTDARIELISPSKHSSVKSN
jgi:hypothetical protein